jgi:predicted amidohydrolase YtcJ
MACPADRIKDIRAVMTVLGGQVVYDAGSLRP